MTPPLHQRKELEPGSGLCMHCGKSRHLAAGCPAKKQHPAGSGNTRTQSQYQGQSWVSIPLCPAVSHSSGILTIPTHQSTKSFPLPLGRSGAPPPCGNIGGLTDQCPWSSNHWVIMQFRVCPTYVGHPLHPLTCLPRSPDQLVIKDSALLLPGISMRLAP